MKRMSLMAKCRRPPWMMLLLLLLGVIMLSACETVPLAQPVGGLHLQRQDRESRREPPRPGEHENSPRVLLEEQLAVQQQQRAPQQQLQRAAHKQQRAAQQQMLEDFPWVLLVSGESSLSELVTHRTAAAAGKKVAAAGLPPVVGGGTQRYCSRLTRKEEQQEVSHPRKGTRPSQHHVGPGLQALLRNAGEERRKARTFVPHDVISCRQMLLKDSGGDERQEEEAATAAQASQRQSGRPDALYSIAPKTVKTAESLRFSLMGAESNRNPAAAAGGAVAKLLVFLLMQSLFGRHFCATKAAALPSIATAGAAAYPLSAAVTASLLGAADFVFPASSSFVSATTSAFSSSASSAKSANERPVAKSAYRQAAREYERNTAAEGALDDSQQRQTLKPPTGEQQQKRAPTLGGQQPQPQMRILTQLGQRQHVNRQRRQQQQRSRQKRVSHKDDSADGQPPLNAAARLATISLRQEQRQQQKQQAEDSEAEEGWSSRVRVSSRSLLAPSSSFLAVPPASRIRQNARGIEDEVAEEPDAKGGSSDKEEKLLRSRSRSSSKDLKTAPSLVTTDEHVLQNTGDRLTRTGGQPEGGGVDDGQQPRVNRGEGNTATQQATEVPAASYLAVKNDEAQWREGVDNKRFPCVLTKRTTEGAVLKQVKGVKTEHKCQRLCRREKSCTHAVLNTAEDMCTLKSGVIDPIWGADSEILIPYTCRDCWHPNAGFNQSPFASRKFYSPYGCTSFCLSQPQCVWWMYNVYDETCQLYSGVGDNDVQWDKRAWTAGRASWCALTWTEEQELKSPEEGEASLGSGWIKSQCMPPPHYKSTAKAFEQFSNLHTADLCQKECQKRPLCRYFDFNRSDNTCRLFEKEGYKVEEANNHLAGPRTCNMSCMLFGRTIKTEDTSEAAPPAAEQPAPSMLATNNFWEVVADTAMECQVRCNEDLNCKRFSYCTESMKCLMSKIGPPRPSMTIKPGAIQEEQEAEEDLDQMELPENELSYKTAEASGCYVGPASFCVTKQ